MYYRQFQGCSCQLGLKLHYLLQNAKHTTRKGNISTLLLCICKVILKSNYWPYNVCPHAIAQRPPNGFCGNSYVVLLPQFLDTLTVVKGSQNNTLYSTNAHLLQLAFPGLYDWQIVLSVRYKLRPKEQPPFETQLCRINHKCVAKTHTMCCIKHEKANSSYPMFQCSSWI